MCDETGLPLRFVILSFEVLRLLHVDGVADDAAEDTPGGGADQAALDPVATRRRADHGTCRRTDDRITLGIPNRLARRTWVVRARRPARTP